jgi:hypothetical protein
MPGFPSVQHWSDSKSRRLILRLRNDKPPYFRVPKNKQEEGYDKF